MARNVTLQQLRTDIESLCDFVESASGRYTPTLLNRLINQSIQRFRERISCEGMTHYLTSSNGTLQGVTGPYAFESLDISALSPSCVRTYGVDVTIQGIVRTLDHRPFTERNDYSDNGYGYPVAWSQYQTYALAIMPSMAGLVYTLWYLPVLADLVNDSDTFDGVSGWENWIVWDVVCQLAARDQYTEASQQFLVLRDGIWADIIRAAPKVTAAGGTFTGRDTVRATRKQDRLAAGGSSSTTTGGSGIGSLADSLMLMGG